MLLAKDGADNTFSPQARVIGDFSSVLPRVPMTLSDICIRPPGSNTSYLE